MFQFTIRISLAFNFERENEFSGFEEFQISNSKLSSADFFFKKNLSGIPSVIKQFGSRPELAFVRPNHVT